MSDERGRGAADDERPYERRDAPEVPAEQPEAEEPEFGSADWLLQQLTGGRHVDRPADAPEASDVPAGDAEADTAAVPEGVASPPPIEVDAVPATPTSSREAEVPTSDEPSPFDELLGSVIEEPEVVEEQPTEFPVAFNWNLTPGVGGDPLVEQEEASRPAEEETAPFAAAPSEPVATASEPAPTDPTPTTLFEPLGVETPSDEPAAPAEPVASAESAAAAEPEPEPEADAAPPLVPPVFRSTFVEPKAPSSAGIFAPFATPQEPSATEPSPAESSDDEEPPAAVRSWVIEPALPTPAPEPEKPRTIFDAPEIPADDEDESGEQEGHGLAALLGFGAPESDVPSGRSVIGDTTSVIPIDPSAFTRPPAPTEPPATPIADAILPPAEEPLTASSSLYQPVLPPIDAAALFEPPVETPEQQQDAAEIADLLRASHEEPELAAPPASPSAYEPPAVFDAPDVVDTPTQQLDTSEIAALLRDEPVESLPSAPAFPAAEAELAMGGLPSPATSPIDAESIASASEPEPFATDPFAPEPFATEPSAPEAADETAADDVEAEESDGLAELFGDVEVEPETGPASPIVGEPLSEPGDESTDESIDEAPEPAAGVEGPQLTATTPFAFTQTVPVDTTAAPPTAPEPSAAPAWELPAAAGASAAAASAATVGTGSAATVSATTADGAAGATAAPASPTGGDFWNSRNNRILLMVGGALAVVLVLIGLFAIGTRIPSWLGAAKPAPVAATASASAKPSATPTPTPTPVPTVTPKPAAAVGAGTHPWDALGGGECIQPFTTVWAEEFTVVDCAAPHTAQLVYTNLLSADPAAPYPGADALAQQIPGLCTAGGVVDLGAAGAYPDLQVTGSFPATEQQWKDGQRSYYCFATRSSGEPLTSSVAGPGPAA
ncbi:hypothetical protein SAMN04515691_0360 [Leifsonia sp. 98AMF]|uniref:hypothetical protein n=1 Tax=unclassified Leifsonia TaxID=2663824 RepID=UPI00087D5642|nr:MULTISPECIES: hypothetical protein [unclassified Leifsonia]SDH68666.1 hypothetical protein SAMN04515690_3660 [Leifsonia sp. 197AMF]SDI71131.1 hypothetical protein SAMN04515684_0129 [Leifsonia sp. 466MF]SDK19099.1 hypothetical protein SAMN04515683_2622 [Leifsonia sp. 157MF]SDN73632.1 hypothetical protein SAMN04515686_2330 [Leifsonia sp. 509MF]SEN34646.1 hypothetical protein SAMN04515685_2606 [Leifsonia sp. 467MF]